MCMACTKAWQLNPRIPDSIDLTDKQRAEFARSKRTTDAHKLNALMPGWYKAHVRAANAAPWREGKVRDFVAQLMADLKATQNAPQYLLIPGQGPLPFGHPAKRQAMAHQDLIDKRPGTMREYILAFEKLNGLRSDNA